MTTTATCENGGMQEYFAQTFESKLLNTVNDLANYKAGSTKLLEKRGEMTSVETALEKQKEEFGVKMTALRTRRSELEKKEQDLAESLRKFDRFIIENDKRKRRAVKKAAEETEQIKSKDVTLEQLKQELKQLQVLHGSQAKAIGSLQTYERFLHGALKLSPEYSNCHELISRYETLFLTNRDLMEIDKTNHAKMDKAKEGMTRFKEEHRVEMLNYNNQLAILQTKLSKAQTESLYWENQLNLVQSTATKRTLLLGRIKMATANLHALVERRGKVVHEGMANDTITQLDKIQIFIQDLKDVTSEDLVEAAT